VTLPEGKFGAILVDPPWHFVCYTDQRVTYLERGRTVRAPEAHYETTDTAAIAALPVASCAADDCALFLWATMPMLPEALQVIAAWGFAYKTCAFTWVKVKADGRPIMGLGYWTRANAELCLLATRGHPKRTHADVPQAIIERRREHSRKPDCVHGRIARLCAGPYLELYGRKSVAGWTVIGNESTLFDCRDEPVATGLWTPQEGLDL